MDVKKKNPTTKGSSLLIYYCYGLIGTKFLQCNFFNLYTCVHKLESAVTLLGVYFRKCLKYAHCFSYMLLPTALFKRMKTCT